MSKEVDEFKTFLGGVKDWFKAYGKWVAIGVLVFGMILLFANVNVG